MKKIFTVWLFALPFLLTSVLAQSKKVASTSSTTKPATVTTSTVAQKASKISDSFNNLIKALSDSLSALPPKSIKKKIYGTLSFVPQVVVYNDKNQEKLPNPNLKKAIDDQNLKKNAKQTKQQSFVDTAKNPPAKNNIAQVADALKYLYVTIDTVKIQFKKNAILWLRIHVVDNNYFRSSTTINFEKPNSADFIPVEINGTSGVIRIKDFLSYASKDDIDDNIQSDLITLTVKNPKTDITGY